MHPPQLRQRALDLMTEGRSLNSISALLGVSRYTLREWRTTGGAFRRLAPGCPREQPIDEPAYAHLLGLYLGDGCISANARGVYSLRIACDALYLRLIDECIRSMSAVLPNRVSVARAPGCVQVTAYSKHWPCLFPQHGSGRKHERPIVLEDWQTAIVERHPDRFVRGLFHSDGCRVTNWTTRTVAGVRKRYEYPRYFFSNRSQDILRLAQWALDLLGVQHRRNSTWSISVARRASVAIMEVAVGPKS